jgi:hypothetical protein
MKSKCLFSGITFLLLPVLANAAITVKLAKPGKLSATLYQGTAVHSVVPAENTPTVQFADADPKGGKWSVHIADQETGNEAIIPVPATGQAEVKPEDFRYITRVSLQVSDPKGGIPDVAILTLKDAKGTVQSVTLATQDAGKAGFQNVAAGEASVTVQQGAQANRQTVSLRLDLKRPAPALELPVTVTLPDGMHTSASAPAAQHAASEPAPSTAPPISHGFLNGFIGFLIALLVFGGLALMVVRSLQRKGVTAKSALAAAGVQLPDDPEPIPIVQAEPPKPVDPTICPFCGARKEANAPCTQCAVGSRAQSSAAPSQAGPLRLVCVAGPRAGESFTIVQGLTVGRDPSRDVSMTDDSALSRQHATFEVSGGSIAVVDNGSSNGTWVNGRRVDRNVLNAGDEVAMGSSRFRVEV